MPKRVLCKFSAHGACLKGEHCEFSHDWKDPPNNICTFYQKGVCAYGSRCRYKHVKVSQLQPSAASSEDVFLPVEHSSGTAVLSADNQSMSAFAVAGDCPWGAGDCPWGAGDCAWGDKYPHIHGDICPICRERCLHSLRRQEREEHMKICEQRKKRSEVLRHSQEIECCVCLERVLSKPTLAERKFGILSECDHPFCISCIRNWRASSPASGLNINSALRACPVCRKISYFVVPSVILYSSKEEKQDIINSYKAKLRTIDCKHFDFGNGTCPFGTSCFYKHAYRDGHLEKVVLRFLGAGGRDTVIAKNIRLSNVLSNLQIR